MTKKLFSLITVIALVSQFLSPWTSIISAEGSGCRGVQYTLEGQIKGNGYITADLCAGGGECWAEGEEVPARLTIKGLTKSNPYSVKIQHDYQKGGTTGYEEFNDATSDNASATGVALDAPVQKSCGGGITCKTYVLSFTAASSEVQLDWDALLGKDASSWSGSSLHFRLVEGVCQESVGKRDVSIPVEKIVLAPYCGDEIVNDGEQCEPPFTSNNPYCGQTPSECLGNKLGTRDLSGDCDCKCGCTYDPFDYQCVKDQCGAECTDDADCNDEDEHTIDTCNLETCGCQHEYVPYCGDGIVNQEWEKCDGEDLDEVTCETLGFDGGTLSCTEGCQLDLDCYNCATVSGYKWFDKNTIGVKDVGDVFDNGRVIELRRGGTQGTLIDSVVTGAGDWLDGYYEFEICEDGDYVIQEIQLNGFTQTHPGGIGQNTPYSINVTNGVVTITGIQPEDDDLGFDFGNFKNIYISGYKFNDLNGNGVKDPGEPGIANWLIQYWGSRTGGDKTDINGYYELPNPSSPWTGLPPGIYYVGENILTGWTQTYPGDPGSYHFEWPDEDISNLNFGNFENIDVTVCKYVDVNGDGDITGDPLYTEGWEVTLGLLGGAHTTVETTVDGCYVFKNVGPGNYDVTENIYGGWTQTFPAFPFYYTFEAISGQNRTFNFGNFKLGKISGYKYNDLSNDGNWDSGEPPLNNWRICLWPGLALNGLGNHLAVSLVGIENCVFTGAGDWPDGYYEFTDLEPGNYNLTEEGKTGWKQTVGPDPVTVSSGENVSELNFGNRGDLSICGTKYNDADESGTLTAGDLVKEGWTITLSGDRSGTVQTGGNGYYCFNYLEPGNYTVTEETRDGWTATSTSSIAIPEMTEDQIVNFFNYPYPVLGIEKVSDVVTFINPGYTVTYTITIGNTGVGPAVDFEVQDVLPSGFSYVDGSGIISGVTGSGPVVSGSALVWTIEKLDSDSSFTITYEVLTASNIAAGSYINTASVMDEKDDCEVEVIIPRVLAAATEKDLPAKVGKVLGAATGSSIAILSLISFAVTSAIYFTRSPRRKRRK